MANILVVEDEDIFRFILRKGLEKAGHQVKEAQDGCIALDMLAQYTPDILLMDLGLPCRDGMSILRMLQEQDMLRQLQVIIMTARYIGPDDDWLRDMGLLIRKPLLMPDLLHVVDIASRRLSCAHH